MRNPYNKIIATLLLCLFFYSCQQSEDIRSIGEAEYYLNEKLSSISIDLDNSIWIGGENGTITNFSDPQKTTYDLGEDRIYKLSRHNIKYTPNQFWIGIRNAGLQRWYLTPDKQIKEKTYPIKYKDYKYSAYDFIFDKDTIYVATSQGLYMHSNYSTNDTLQLIYPSEEILQQQNGYSFIIRKLTYYQNQLVLAATQAGLLLHNTATRDQFTVLEDSVVDYVTVYGDTIYALAQGILYQINKSGEILKAIRVNRLAKVYYQIEGIHYFIGAQEIWFSNDLINFKTYKLRKKIPLYSRNILAIDTTQNFSFLLTENALWRIPNHIDLFRSNNPIHIITNFDKTKYYLDDNNQLYKQIGDINKAKWIYSFPSNEEIKWMQYLDGSIHYVTSNNELKKLTLFNNTLRNNIFNSPKIIFKSTDKITACLIKRHGDNEFTYLGVQDGLLKIDERGNIDTLSLFNDKYITSIFSHNYTDQLYLSTLNHGIFYLNVNNDVEQIKSTEHNSFINDVISTNDYNHTIIALTNHKLITLNPADTLMLKGYGKLLYANDSTFYAIPEYGIHKFRLRRGKLHSAGIFYNDIHFNHWATIAVNDKLFLGSNLGVLELSIDKENTPNWVNISAPIPFNWYYFLFILFFVSIIVFFSIHFTLHKKRHSQKQIKQQKDDLMNRLLDLDNFYQIVCQKDSTTIQNISDSINAIDATSENTQKIKSDIERISLKLINLNRETTLILPQKIDEQIAQISKSVLFDKYELLKQTETAKKSNDIELLKKQVVKNDLWLNKSSEIETKLTNALNTLDGCMEVESVNKGLYTALLTLNKEKEYKPLSIISATLENLLKTFNSIQSEEALIIILDNISRIQHSLIPYKENYKSIVDELDNVVNRVSKLTLPEDRFTLLRKLYHINNQVQVLENISALRDSMFHYKKRRKELVLENDKLINKRFDTAFDNYIADQLKEEVEAIGRLIDRLYYFIMLTDQKVLIDILNLPNHQEQQPRVLALLLADSKIKRTLIPGILGIYGNLNPVISRLINGRIKTSKKTLEEYIQTSGVPSVFATLILELVE